MIERVYGMIFVNGEPCPVTNLIDLDGDETDEIELAVTAVTQAPDGQWVVFNIESTGIWPLQ